MRNRFFRAFLGLVEKSGSMGYFRHETIEILQYVDEDIEKRYSDQKTYESEYMFGNEKYQKRQEYRKFHVSGHYFRIEVVGFHRMNEHHHTEYGHDNINAAIVVSDDKDRDGR